MGTKNKQLPTQGEWIWKNELGSGRLLIKRGDDIIAQVSTSLQVPISEIDANAQAICKAVNNTYGKGINPEAVESLKEALEVLIKNIELLSAKQFYSEISIAKEAIKKAEL